MSSVNLFQTGKSGLFANRAALATTGHNISNVNTEGYSRQRVEQTPNKPSQIGNVVYGTGVRVNQIHRINDEYLTKQISNEMKLMGQYEEKDMALSQAEAIFNEIGNAGLNRLVSRFFNEFRKLGNEPESEALRATVKESADQLIGDFKRISRNIDGVQRNLDTRIEASVRQVNELVGRVAQLNEEVKRMELSGGNAGDLRDARDKAIKELSTTIDTSVGSNEKGELTVSVLGIGPLVSGSLFNKLYVQTSKANPEKGTPEGSFKIFVEGLPNDVTDKMKNSRLGGLVESRDQYLGTARKRIDELAYHMAKKINEVHRSGFAINGSTGIDFFKEPTSIHQAAELMSLSKEVQGNPNNIATALEPDSPGDNRVTQMIIALQHQRIMGDGTSSFDEHYNTTVADLATVAQKNKQVFEHQEHIVNQLNKFRESISGVSLDEETTNLVQFQHAFDASAKVIKVADEILDTVLHLRS